MTAVVFTESQRRAACVLALQTLIEQDGMVFAQDAYWLVRSLVPFVPRKGEVRVARETLGLSVRHIQPHGIFWVPAGSTTSVLAAALATHDEYVARLHRARGARLAAMRVENKRRAAEITEKTLAAAARVERRGATAPYQPGDIRRLSEFAPDYDPFVESVRARVSDAVLFPHDDEPD